MFDILSDEERNGEKGSKYDYNKQKELSAHPLCMSARQMQEKNIFVFEM